MNKRVFGKVGTFLWARRRWAFGLPILFFLLFYFYPLAAILRLGLLFNGRFQFSHIFQFLIDPTFLNILWFTLWQAVVSTVLTVGLAIPGAYIFARYRFYGKATIKAIMTLPFVLPTVVVANAFTALLGPRGLLNETAVSLLGFDSPPIDLERTIWMILLAHVFYNYSVALRMISGFWQNLDPDLSEAGQMLGASPMVAFWKISWPLLRPAIFAAAVLVFTFSFTSFGVILILGGPGYATLEVEIYRQAVNLFDLPVAATLSLLQIVFTFVLMWFYTQSQSRLIRPLQLKAQTERPVKTAQARFMVWGNLGFMLILLGFPLFALVARSFIGESGLTLRFYQQLTVNERGSIFFVPPGTAVLNSVAYALATVLIAVSLGLISTLLINRPKTNHSSLPSQSDSSSFPIYAKLRDFLNNPRFLDPLFMLPIATSAVTLGFGYIIALNRPPLNLRQSLVLVPIAHSLVAIPFVIRSVLPAVRRIDPKLREAAIILGATDQQVWREVDWPLIRRAVLVGAVFAFTISMGEFGATVFISRPDTPTMPVAIFRFLGQPGAINYGQALAMSSLLMLVCTVGFVAIERFRLGDEGEF